MTTAAVVLSEVSSLYTRLAARRRRETIRDIFDIKNDHIFSRYILSHDNTKILKRL
ncbi:unnamed protein product [Schistosoma mattheei]|uniref:Uncharacterized protein n=1 Tax=Schistosoma mattheei TaxID=31246 RepID=A0A3P7XEQ2_9TREM|nr:unnamed protein product [Schistosoma mattheei]